MASAVGAGTPQQGARTSQPAHQGGLPGGEADVTELWPNIRKKLCFYLKSTPE